MERDIDAVVEPAGSAASISKVIIEAALLTDDEKITACTLAKAAGADFVKTSTGFASGGATAADVALMRRVVGADMGVKAAGGVRDLEGLKAMVAAGATRVGASAGVKIVQESAGQKPAPAAAHRLLTVGCSTPILRHGAVDGTGKGIAEPVLCERLDDPPAQLTPHEPLLRRHGLDPRLQMRPTSRRTRPHPALRSVPGSTGPNVGSACSSAPTSRNTAVIASESS